MRRFAVLMVIALALALGACGMASPNADFSLQSTEESARSNSSGKAQSSGGGAVGAPSPDAVAGFGFGEAEPFPEPAAPPAEFFGADDGTVDVTNNQSVQFPSAQRQVISTASISVEVEAVSGAVDQVRSIAEGLGGFVEQLSSSGRGDQEQAYLTIRVPQPEFFTALERIEALGEVQNRNVGSEDVSEEFIDLEARLKSAQREEESLLSLLERANNVTEILTIERELTRVRSEIERFQGRLNFLERRVDLSTISVSLVAPHEETPEPPSASFVVVTNKVPEGVDAIKGLVSSLNGEVDRVFLSTRDGLDRADISFRVNRTDFDQTVAFTEDQGDVRSKEIQEGAEDADFTPEEPDARISLSLIEVESSREWIIWAVGTPIAVIVVVAVVGAGLVMAYRRGRGRRSFVQG